MLRRLKSWQVVFLQTVGLTALCLIWGIGFTLLSRTNFALAGDLTYVSATLSDTRYSSTTNITFEFDLATTIASSTVSSTVACNLDPCAAVDLIFPRNSSTSDIYFTLQGSIATSDISVATATTSFTVSQVLVTTTNAYSTSSYKDLIRVMFNLNGKAIVTGTTMNVAVNGKNITNPAKVGGSSGDGVFDAYQMDVETAVSSTALDYGYQILDYGSTKSATHEGVHVHVGVSDVFTFTVAGIPNDGSFKWGGTEIPTVGSSSTTCPFGTLNPNRARTCGQTLTVNTNATNGYVVFVHQDHNLQAGPDDIDQFNSGTAVICDPVNASTTSCASRAEDWSPPAVVFGNENTWGHLGYSSDDTNVFPSHTKYAAIGDEGTAMTQSSPVMANSVGTGLDETVHSKFKVEISPLQEPGDYTNEVWYVAAPRF